MWVWHSMRPQTAGIVTESTLQRLPGSMRGARCQQDGGILAEIPDDQAYNTITSYLDANLKGVNTWIGYSSYVWLDQEGG